MSILIPEPKSKKINGYDFQNWKTEIGLLDLAKLDFEPIKWILPGIIPQGLTVFAGDPKSGKSYFIFQLVMACIYKLPFCLNLEVTNNINKSLNFLLDDPVRRLWSRAHDYLNHLDVNEEVNEKLRFRFAWPDTKDPLKSFEDIIKKHDDIDILVIDVLSRIWQNSKSGKSLYNADYEQLSDLKDMLDSYGISSVVTHHTNQGEHNNQFHRIQGSQGIIGAADSIVLLSKEKDGLYFNIEGNDIPTMRIPAQFTDNKRWLLYPTEAKLTNEEQKLYEFALSVSEFVCKDYCEISGKSDSSVYNLINTLHDKGVIEKCRCEKGYPIRGRYKLKK